MCDMYVLFNPVVCMMTGSYSRSPEMVSSVSTFTSLIFHKKMKVGPRHEGIGGDGNIDRLVPGLGAAEKHAMSITDDCCDSRVERAFSHLKIFSFIVSPKLLAISQHPISTSPSKTRPNPFQTPWSHQNKSPKIRPELSIP